jgi:hypothetical protein
MKIPVPPKVRTRRAPGPSPEVARVKALYLRALRARLRDGTYATEQRVRVALDRMVDALRDDLPE